MTPVLLFIVPTAGWPVWLLSLPHSTGQNNAIMKSPVLFSTSVCSQIESFFPLYLPSVSSRREWQLALGKPVRWWARRPTLPLLSDLAEHPKALHRFVKAPCGQRRQVSSVWLFVTEPLRVMHVQIIWVNQPAPTHSNKKEKTVLFL